VISIGNLTTGGTGKTPLVEWVCRAIAGKGTEHLAAAKSVCVLTRGYRRDNPRAQVVVSDGVQLLAGERESGDEAFLLAQDLLGTAAVVANQDRLVAGQWAIKNLKAECFVLDDGFQHLQLARDLDIVTVDATNPWGGGSLLPSGRLREPRAGLSRAGCVVITRSDQVENVASLKTAVKQLVGEVPVFTSRMVTSDIRGLNGERVNMESLGPQALVAFCGVGNPESFFKHLRREGFTLASTRAFGDHHDYNQVDVDGLVKEAKSVGAAALITTAKDATKLSAFDFDPPCYVLEIQILIDDAEQLINMVRKTVGVGVGA
jgi:tetraacyldisaccharide 4'-kinase